MTNTSIFLKLYRRKSFNNIREREEDNVFLQTHADLKKINLKKKIFFIFLKNLFLKKFFGGKKFFFPKFEGPKTCFWRC